LEADIVSALYFGAVDGIYELVRGLDAAPAASIDFDLSMISSAKVVLQMTDTAC
jgi:hypothetical protein